MILLAVIVSTGTRFGTDVKLTNSMRVLHKCVLAMLSGLLYCGAMSGQSITGKTAPLAEPWRHQFAAVNGVKLHYVEQGKGPIILFLHGWPEFWYAWKDLLPEFAKDHHACAVDMRGYNLSAMPPGVEAYRVPAIVADIRALVTKLGAHRIILVGHDWGAVIAWHFAAEHPEMVNRLVIINGPHPVILARELATNPEQQKASAYFNLLAMPNAEATLVQNDYQALQRLLTPWATEEERKQYLESWRRGISGGVNYYRAAGLKSPISEAEMDAAVRAFTAGPSAVPTLVIWGEKDPYLLPENLIGLEKQVRKLNILRVPAAGHWIVHEQPKVVIQAIRDFLQH